MKKEKMMLRPYQEQAVQAVREAIREGKKEIVVEIATGAGKSLIMKEIAKQFQKEEVMILTRRREIREQLKQRMPEIEVVLYQECFARLDKKLKYILINEIEIVSQEKYEKIKETLPNTIFIVFTNKVRENDWLKRENLCFSYSMDQALNEGYLITNYNETEFQDFFLTILKKGDFSEIKKEVIISTR